jgi:hypothetical protein
MVDPIWRRYFNDDLVAKQLSDYQLLLGTTLLRMSKLEHRIQGFRYIKQAITDVRQAVNHSSKHRSPAQLVAIVKE